jgi:hypothetical protein
MGNNPVFVKSYGAPGRQKLFYLTGIRDEIFLYTWTFSQRHRIENKSAVGTNGHTVTAVDAGFFTILQQSRESVFIS